QITGPSASNTDAAAYCNPVPQPTAVPPTAVPPVPTPVPAPVPIPEPLTLVLFGTGLAAAGIAARLRKR
ncbi:MAG: PEP-CTERM sorting domain-containing protein, partial [Caldilinea sp.]